MPQFDVSAGADVPVGATPPAPPLAVISDQPLSREEFEAAIDHPQAGARVVFCGVVRDHDRGRQVTELEYQGHPSAQSVLAGIAERMSAEPGVLAVAAAHRVGTLRVGEVALIAAVATAHRGAAFDRCARLVEDIKHGLPIWKRQVFSDGSDEWVNCP